MRRHESAGAGNIPLLLVFYFEEWLAERKRSYTASTTKRAMLTWRRLLRQCCKMPWEMGWEDIEWQAAWI